MLAIFLTKTLKISLTFIIIFIFTCFIWEAKTELPLLVHSQMPKVAGAGLDWSQERGTQSRPPIWVAGTQLFEKSWLPTRVCISRKMESGARGGFGIPALQYGMLWLNWALNCQAKCPPFIIIFKRSRRQSHSRGLSFNFWKNVRHPCWSHFTTDERKLLDLQCMSWHWLISKMWRSNKSQNS